MGLFTKRLKRAAVFAAVLVPTFLVTACLNSEPKVLGQQGLFDFSAFNGAGVSASFVFNFALATTTTTTVNNVTTTVNTVALQGSTNAQSAITGTCNLNAQTAASTNFVPATGNQQQIIIAAHRTHHRKNLRIEGVITFTIDVNKAGTLHQRIKCNRY